ncbi:MAG: glycosyltransferase, partial [Actinomycetota bacterium]|nr:glycosyltransferase [Actinomycetota bacterium]
YLSYRFLIIDPYYENFLNAFYKKHPQVLAYDYDNALKALMAECFGTADFYSSNLISLGHEAVDVIANDRVLQQKWAKQNRVKVSNPSFISRFIQRIPYIRRFSRPAAWILAILESQVKTIKPDILYFHNISLCEPDFVEKVKKHVKLVVGQIACPLPAERCLHSCDLILTSFPHYVERFRKMGIASEYFRLAFEASLIRRLQNLPQKYETVFIGGISKAHGEGTRTLEYLAAKVKVDFWGYGVEALPPNSYIRRNFHGEAWGLDMYNILHNSKIVVNRHIDVAENYANNMRLYEATGAGAFLITDYRDNLNELFEIGKEVEVYRSAEELVEKVKYYLAHDDERKKIAEAGQARTLRDHTWEKRMAELVEIIERYI